MNLGERLIRLGKIHLNDLGAAAFSSVEKVFQEGVRWADDRLSEAERRAFGEEQSTSEGSAGAKAKPHPPGAEAGKESPPVKPTPPAGKPVFQQFTDFTRTFEGAKSGKISLSDHEVLKLLDAAEERGFTARLGNWMGSPENKETILVPLTRLLMTPSSDEKLHDRVFYRIHRLGLQEELLKWMASGPHAGPRLNDTIGLEYAGFNAQLEKRANRAVGPAERVELSEEEKRGAKRFAVRVQAELEKGGR